MPAQLPRLAAMFSIAVAVAACGGAPATTDPAPDADAAEGSGETGPTGEVRALEVGGSMMAFLPQDVVEVDEGTPVARWEVEITEPGMARIELLSEELDTVLRVTAPDGRTWRNDDWNGTNSMVQLTTFPAGTWTIDAMPYDPESEGRLTVRWSEFDADAQLPLLTPDAAIEGALSPGGAGFGGTTSEAGVWIDARAGERLRVRVTSPDFDTTALLIGPGGQRWFNDDANDTGPDGSESTLDSTVQAVVGDTGRYQLIVAPYGGNGAGRFAARVEVADPIVILPGERVPEAPYAGVDVTGRMYGIFLGIETYSEFDILPGCDDDATLLAQAFRDRGLMRAEDQVILTDHKVTRAAFTTAIEELAARVGPDDTVVFFFSGHGGTLPVAEDDTWEIDGVDETLVFHDGQMVDHEVVRWLDTIDVGTMMLALDSCQSGGFVRDFMTRPGRIALMSSDEDVLSSTAQPVGAGGYLSYALREAVLQAGDQRPNDGALYAGELTDALIGSFQQHYRDMNPDGSFEPLQRLVMDRGSYNWNDLLWIYPRNPDGTFYGLTNDACEPAAMDVGATAMCE